MERAVYRRFWQKRKENGGSEGTATNPAQFTGLKLAVRGVDIRMHVAGVGQLLGIPEGAYCERRCIGRFNHGICKCGGHGDEASLAPTVARGIGLVSMPASMSDTVGASPTRCCLIQEQVTDNIVPVGVNYKFNQTRSQKSVVQQRGLLLFDGFASAST